MGGIAGGDAASDLFFMCHGWNNNMDDATSLYSGLAALIKAQVDANPSLATRKYAICGVLWPSKKFEDKDLIPERSGIAQRCRDHGPVEATGSRSEVVIRGVGMANGGGAGARRVR